MLKRWTIRIIFGLVCGLSLTLFTFMVSEAKPEAQTALPSDCNECHESVVINWQDSQHGQSMTDPAFQAAWQDQGSPTECLACHTTGYDAETQTWHEDSVGCEACHSMGEDATHHPEQVMPTNRSSEACGSCHVETHDDWQLSQHAKEELTCVRCHNPHTTKIKTDSVQELCITCHNEDAYYFAFTAHSQEGLLCTDCHLTVSTEPLGDGHSKRSHTFGVDLQTCNACHDHEMHSPMQDAVLMNGVLPTSAGDGLDGQATAVSTCESLTALQSSRSHIVSAETIVPSAPVSDTTPFAFVIPTAFGLLMGVMLSPLFERAYRRTRVN